MDVGTADDVRRAVVLGTTAGAALGDRDLRRRETCELCDALANEDVPGEVRRPVIRIDEPGETCALGRRQDGGSVDAALDRDDSAHRVAREDQSRPP